MNIVVVQSCPNEGLPRAFQRSGAMLHVVDLESSERPQLGRDKPLPAGALAELVRQIACACNGQIDSMRDRIVAALAAAAADPALVTAEQCQPQADCYARHVLWGDPDRRFTVLALVWAPGQFSPPHAHHAWCAYAVRAGTLSETLYGFDSVVGTARPLRVAARSAGYACFAQAGLDQIHRLGNAGTEPAISIHVYGVARERIATDVNRIVEVAHSKDER
jgi:predicted metal-dependent enzyme (double-stranded beta helix superfamily)